MYVVPFMYLFRRIISYLIFIHDFKQPQELVTTFHQVA